MSTVATRSKAVGRARRAISCSWLRLRGEPPPSPEGCGRWGWDGYVRGVALGTGTGGGGGGWEGQVGLRVRRHAQGAQSAERGRPSSRSGQVVWRGGCQAG